MISGHDPTIEDLSFDLTVRALLLSLVSTQSFADANRIRHPDGRKGVSAACEWNAGRENPLSMEQCNDVSWDGITNSDERCRR